MPSIDVVNLKDLPYFAINTSLVKEGKDNDILELLNDSEGEIIAFDSELCYSMNGYNALRLIKAVELMKSRNLFIPIAEAEKLYCNAIDCCHNDQRLCKTIPEFAREHEVIDYGVAPVCKTYREKKYCKKEGCINLADFKSRTTGEYSCAIHAEPLSIGNELEKV